MLSDLKTAFTFTPTLISKFVIDTSTRDDLSTGCGEKEGYFQISNGNRTEWSPIRSVIIRVIRKSDDRAAGVRFVYHSYD